MLMGEGNVIREYNAMHEVNFISSWLRDDLVEKEERRNKVKQRVGEEEGRRRRRRRKWRQERQERREGKDGEKE